MRAKVFISYSVKDEAFARKLANILQQNEIQVWIDQLEVSPGDNIFQKVEEGVRSSNVIIPVLSRNYVSSKWPMQELSMFAAKALSDQSIRIIPALIEECDIPVFLRDRVYVDFRLSFSEGISRILKSLKNSVTQHEEPPAARESGKQSSHALHAQRLSKHLRDGELTLVCGAGVSVDAGAPTWPTLLNELLSNLIRRKLADGPPSPDDQKKLAELYQRFFKPSPLVAAQYLKNGLGGDFLEAVRRTLYAQPPNTSDLLDSIIDMCRPQRSRQSLNSIITFNFDDLLEVNLEQNHIRCRAIFAEGQKANRSELPVYHVHGYLPRTGNIDPAHAIVLSEDAYHSQFIEPFSWSNMIQLNHFSQYVCVFIGLSMSDPNLRRLLDVAMRKNPERRANHYVFKKRFDPGLLEHEIRDLGLPGNNQETAQGFAGMSEILEEQDSLNLGLNTIWIDNYSEIPSFLRKLTTEV